MKRVAIAMAVVGLSMWLFDADIFARGGGGGGGGRGGGGFSGGARPSGGAGFSHSPSMSRAAPGPGAFQPMQRQDPPNNRAMSETWARQAVEAVWQAVRPAPQRFPAHQAGRAVTGRPSGTLLTQEHGWRRALQPQPGGPRRHGTRRTPIAAVARSRQPTTTAIPSSIRTARFITVVSRWLQPSSTISRQPKLLPPGHKPKMRNGCRSGSSA